MEVLSENSPKQWVITKSIQLLLFAMFFFFCLFLFTPCYPINLHHVFQVCLQYYIHIFVCFLFGLGYQISMKTLHFLVRFYPSLKKNILHRGGGGFPGWGTGPQQRLIRVIGLLKQRDSPQLLTILTSRRSSNEIESWELSTYIYINVYSTSFEFRFHVLPKKQGFTMVSSCLCSPSPSISVTRSPRGLVRQTQTMSGHRSDGTGRYTTWRTGGYRWVRAV